MKSVTVTEYTDVAGINNLIESLQSQLAQMTAQRDGLLRAAEAVIWFEYSDDDDDVKAATANLRAAIASQKDQSNAL